MNSGENDLPSHQGDPDAGSICLGCGKLVASSFVFCPHCGAGLSAGPAVSGTQSSPGLVRTPAPHSPPAFTPSPIANEEIVELDEVAFEEVVICWRCDLHNPSDTLDCIHCEASIKVAGKKKKGGRSKLPLPPARPGRLSSPPNAPSAARSPLSPPPIARAAGHAAEVPMRSADLSERRDQSPAISKQAVPQPSGERPPTRPMPFQTPSPLANVPGEIDILDDAEISILPEGETVDGQSASTSLVPGQPSRLGPARDGSFKATVYSRKTSKPGKTKTEIERSSRSHILFPVLIGYGLMLAVSIAMYVAIAIAHWMKIEMPPKASIWGEILDTLVVLWLVFHCKLENFGGGRKVFAWVSAVPALAALYSGNVIISDWVHRMLGYEDMGRRADSPADRDPINFYEIVTTSIQPGVIEELFCRHLLQGSLQKLTGPHAAIWVAAAMFALLHLYNPLGVPYLFLCGLVLGYYRYWSGSLVLPMTMHALHNFAVMVGASF